MDRGSKTPSLATTDPTPPQQSPKALSSLRQPSALVGGGRSPRTQRAYANCCRPRTMLKEAAARVTTGSRARSRRRCTCVTSPMSGGTCPGVEAAHVNVLGDAPNRVAGTAPAKRPHYADNAMPQPSRVLACRAARRCRAQTRGCADRRDAAPCPDVTLTPFGRSWPEGLLENSRAVVRGLAALRSIEQRFAVDGHDGPAHEVTELGRPGPLIPDAKSVAYRAA